MRTAGIIIFGVDLIKTLYTGLSNISKENAEESEKQKIKRIDHHVPGWLSYAGIGMMVMGGAILVLGRKKT
jgi:hypothetical protein